MNNTRSTDFIRLVILGIAATVVGACGDPLPDADGSGSGSGGDGPTGAGQGGSSASTSTAGLGGTGGTGTGGAPNTPVPIQLTAGSDISCALISDGTVRCWGTSLLGDGTDDESETPVQVLGIADAVQVAAGWNVTCVRRRTQSVACWGFGAIGNGAMGGSTEPAELDLGGVTDVAVGWAHACAVNGTGIVCWGDNGEGQLGNGTKDVQLIPSAVSFLNAADQLALGNGFTLARLGDSAEGWGFTADSQLGFLSPFDKTEPWPLRHLAGVLDIDAGERHACGLFAAGEARCWGDNGHGAVGTDPQVASSSPPIAVQGLGTTLQVEAGGFHSCALLADHTVKCWGDNFYGALGIGMDGPEETWTPTSVVGLEDVAEVAAGDNHTCARKNDGSVYCWGAIHGPYAYAFEPEPISF